MFQPLKSMWMYQGEWLSWTLYVYVCQLTHFDFIRALWNFLAISSSLMLFRACCLLFLHTILTLLLYVFRNSRASSVPPGGYYSSSVFINRHAATPFRWDKSRLKEKNYIFLRDRSLSVSPAVRATVRYIKVNECYHSSIKTSLRIAPPMSLITTQTSTSRWSTTWASWRGRTLRGPTSPRPETGQKKL